MRERFGSARNEGGWAREFSRAATAVVVAFAAPSCTRASDRLAYGSGDDVIAILRANGVSPGAVHCANPRLGGHVIRAVACTTTLTVADVATLVARVPLAPSDAAGGSDSDDCEHSAGLRSTDPGVSVSSGRNTRVTNGVGPVELHFVAATGAACIEIRYPWS